MTEKEETATLEFNIKMFFSEMQHELSLIIIFKASKTKIFTPKLLKKVNLRKTFKNNIPFAYRSHYYTTIYAKKQGDCTELKRRLTKPE
jgi:hypothetical protein